MFERGNELEKEEITRFYGKDKVEAALKQEQENLIQGDFLHT